MSDHTVMLVVVLGALHFNENVNMFIPPPHPRPPRTTSEWKLQIGHDFFHLIYNKLYNTESSLLVLNKLQNIQEFFVPYLHSDINVCNLVFTQRTNFNPYRSNISGCKTKDEICRCIIGNGILQTTRFLTPFLLKMMYPPSVMKWSLARQSLGVLGYFINYGVTNILIL